MRKQFDKKDANRHHLIDYVWHIRQNKDSFVCAEIGVWKGGFATRILEEVEPTELHLIDPWAIVSDNVKEFYYAGSPNQQQMDQYYDNVCNKFKNYNYVYVHRAPSILASDNFTNAYFDFVYIDGAHDYDNVKIDLNSWFLKIKKNGLLCGDDYEWNKYGRFYVKEAVDEFIQKHNIKVISIKNGQFILEC